MSHFVMSKSGKYAAVKFGYDVTVLILKVTDHSCMKEVTKLFSDNYMLM